jgi:hypothetical protein
MKAQRYSSAVLTYLGDLNTYSISNIYLMNETLPSTTILFSTANGLISETRIKGRAREK